MITFSSVGIDGKFIKNIDGVNVALGLAHRLKYDISRLSDENRQGHYLKSDYGILTLRNAQNEELRLDNVLAYVKRKNKVVASSFLDEPGQLIEMSGTGLYDIVLSILLIGEADSEMSYPENQLTDFLEFLHKSEQSCIPSLSVSHKFLSIFGISDVCVTDVAIHQDCTNCVNIYVRCLSDCIDEVYDSTEKEI